MSNRREVERRCTEYAVEQWGIITANEALAAGMSSSAVQRHIQRGEWLRVHPSTYRLGAWPRSWEQELMAACSWAGPTSAASHRAAARLLELGVDQAPTEIVMTERKKGPRSIRTHFTHLLEPCDVTRHRGIPVTTASRTLIDLGAVVPQPVVERALESALRLGLTSIWHLIGRLDVLGAPGRNGTGTIRAVLRDRDPRLAPTGSELESMLWQIICSSHLPMPERQFHIHDKDGLIGRCDFVYPAHFLVIEVQSARWHLEKPSWLKDMERRNRLTLAGWRIIEVAWQDIVRAPRKVVERLNAALRVNPVANRP